MYKYDPAVTVVTKGGNTYEFGAEYGISAQRSIDQKTAVDTIDDIEGKRTFIPYEAIDHVVIDGMSQQEADPEDANCVVKSKSGSAELKITNNRSDPSSINIALKTYNPATFSGYAFTADLSSTMGAGWYGQSGDSIPLGVGQSITISGIPDGTDYVVINSIGGRYSGSVPADVVMDGGIS